MKVARHAEATLVALTQKLPVPASVLLAKLKEQPAPSRSTAIELCRLKFAYGQLGSSNGDSVVVIVRDGEVKTAMLRRSYNQPFTPEAFRVEEVIRWT